MEMKVIGMSRIKSYNECKGMNTVPGSYKSLGHAKDYGSSRSVIVGYGAGASVDPSNVLQILYGYIRNVVTTLHSCWEL